MSAKVIHCDVFHPIMQGCISICSTVAEVAAQLRQPPLLLAILVIQLCRSFSFACMEAPPSMYLIEFIWNYNYS